MAAGLLFIAKTPGYFDPMSYLFGNILLISKEDLFLVLILDILVVGLVTIFYNNFLAICFDEEYARLRGIKTQWFYLLLLCLTALTVVLLIRVVGIVMVIALLTLPAAIAGNFAKGVRQMMLLAVLLCMIFVATGLCASFILDLPSGPVIIMIAGVVYLFVLLGLRLGRNGH
jgi:zinc transport system permease protein